jgi:hypothetical protein
MLSLLSWTGLIYEIGITLSMYLGVAEIISEMLSAFVGHLAGPRFGSWVPLSTILVAGAYMSMQTVTSSSQFHLLLALVALQCIPMEYTITASFALVSSMVGALNRPSVALVATAFYCFGWSSH